MLTGNWKNFEELEDAISLPELEAMIKARRNYDATKQRFLAALKGIKMDEPNQSSDKFNEVKRRALAKQNNMTEEQVQLLEAGFTQEDI